MLGLALRASVSVFQVSANGMALWVITKPGTGGTRAADGRSATAGAADIVSTTTAAAVSKFPRNFMGSPDIGNL